MTPPSFEELSRECARLTEALPANPLAAGLKIALYGAGFLGAWGIRWLRENGVEPVAIADGDPRRTGSDFSGIKVVAPETLAEIEPDLVFVTARHHVRTVKETLNARGIAGIALDAYIVAAQHAAFRDVHDNLLTDDRSRSTLRAVLSAMLTGTNAALEAVVERDQYFCLPRFAGNTRESYVDAGAYVGDSVERFIWSTSGAFKKIHAFEPSARQFGAMKTRLTRLAAEWALPPDAIALHHLGLSDARTRMGASTTHSDLQSLSLTEVSDGSIDTDTLDHVLDGEEVTFIKADVEGMELPLLRGAARTITRFRPKLAICVYHYPSDIPEISGFIRNLVPDYRFALRHHSPQLLETVLYCWVE